MKKRIVSILLTMCMVLCLMPTAAFAEAAPTGTALTQENISNYKQEKNSTYSENGVYLPAGNYYLAEDIYLVGDDADPNSAWPLLISEGDVTLDLNGHVLDLRGKNISTFASLTLTDSDPDAEHKFRVEDSGLWVPDETRGTKTVAGGVITGGTGVNGGNGSIGTLGGGVNVSGGSLTMEGGSIVGCTANSGGGVRVDERSSFTMNGGRIAGCTAVKERSNYGSGGGVRVDERSSFTMNGGRIEGCTAADAGGGVDAGGDSFTMNGGSITNCTAGGAANAVHADGDFTDNTGTIDRKLVSGIKAGHTGTVDDPILIGSAAGLKDFRDKVNGGQTDLCAKLLCDIVLNEGSFDENGNWSEGGAPESWTPINNYTGTFDGNGHTIKGLYVDVKGIAGLFGEIRGATIRDVTVDGYVKGTSVAGGIAGMALNNATSIQNCVNRCYVVAEGGTGSGNAGGIVGAFSDASISSCYNTGAVSGTNRVGGIAGYPTGGSISSCYNTGAVSGTDCVGGVVGRAAANYSGDNASISSCYNTGAVSGINYVGGIAGFPTRGSISSCYNTGTVSGTDCVGGIAGFPTGGSISSCYNTGAVSGTNDVGGVAGYVFADVSDCYYLTGTAENAVGESAGGTVTSVDARAKTEFAGGDVLALLKQNDTTNAWMDTCGYLKAAGMTLPLLSWQTADAHICTPEDSSRWESDENGHWQVCSCGFSVNKGDHSGTDDGNCTTEVSCDKCGYVIKLAQTEHNWSDWEHLTTTHTRKCNNPGCSATDTKNCLDENKDHKCDTCEAVMSQCADNNNDHKCEICNKVISNHDDADGDHICDVCNKAISNHNDADSDHICDICNKAISNHNDTNSDHICDICNKAISNHDDADGDHICDICDKVISNHTGGTATCTAKAKCEVCGEKYGDLKPHSYSADWVTDETSHWHECTKCGAKTDEAEHIDADKDHKCDVCEKVLSECADNDKDHKCDLCGKVLSEHTGGTATCTETAKCKICGESYGELDSNNHADMKHIEAKAATKTDEGNIEYWYCEDCDKYFADKDENKEITKADTVTAKLPEEKPTSPKTGDTSNLALWIALLFISGGAVTGVTVMGKKKKQQN